MLCSSVSDLPAQCPHMGGLNVRGPRHAHLKPDSALQPLGGHPPGQGQGLEAPPESITGHMPTNPPPADLSRERQTQDVLGATGVPA